MIFFPDILFGHFITIGIIAPGIISIKDLNYELQINDRLGSRINKMKIPMLFN